MRTLRLALVLGCFLVFANTPGRAEELPKFDPHEQPRQFTVRATNAARNAIEEARKSLGKGEIQVALRKLQFVLDEKSNDFFLVEDKSRPSSVLWRAAAEEARRILASLDRQGREAYERRAEPRARRLLDEALRTGRADALHELLNRFGASSAGRAAGRVLALLAYESGRFHDAADYTRRTLRFAPRDAELWRLQIDSLRAAEERETLAALQPPTDLADTTPEGVTLLTAHQAQALASLPEDKSDRNWPMWGGSPSRTRSLAEQSPEPRELRQRARTFWHGRERDSYRRATQDLSHEKLSEMLNHFRPMHVAVSGRHVYAADGRAVHAFDLYSGETDWRFPSARDRREDKHGDRLPFKTYAPTQAADGRTSIERVFAPVVANGRVITTVESWRRYDPEWLQRVEISLYLPRRHLVALDAKTGRLLWASGTLIADRMHLTDHTISGPPVVADGLVLALASEYRNIHAVSMLAFDLETGELRWQRRLGTGQQELNLFGIPVKELAGSAISVRGGVAYVTTGLGFMAAVEVRTGNPRWLASYEIIEVKPTEYWYKAPIRLPSVAPSPPLVTEDLVVVAPTEGRHFHAFDRQTGELIWRWPYRIGDFGRLPPAHPIQVIGIAKSKERRLLLYTDTKLRALDIDGEPGKRQAWNSIETDSPVVGQGAISGETVMVPTEDALNRYSLKQQGKFIGSTPWPERASAGNLLPLDHVLLVTSRESVQWFYDWEALEREVARRRKQNPTDPSVLLEAGELYLNAPDGTARARQAFQEALSIAGKDDEEARAHARRGMHRSWVREARRLRAVPPRAIKAWEEALRWADPGEQRLEARLALGPLLADDVPAATRNLEAWVAESGAHLRYEFDPAHGEVLARLEGLFRLATLQEQSGELEAAVTTLQQVVETAEEETFGLEAASEIGIWRISALLARHGREPYANHERRAVKLLAAARRERDEAAFDELIANYPNASIVPEALFERSQLRLQAGDPSNAIDGLRQILADAPLHDIAVPALALLAHAYRLEGALGAARSALVRIEESVPQDQELSLAGKRLTARAFIEQEQAAIAKLVGPDLVEPALTPPLGEVHFERAGDETNGRAIDIRAAPYPDGRKRAPPYTAMAVGTELAVFDMRRGALAWRKSVGNVKRTGAFVAGRLITVIGNQLRAFDAATGAAGWRHPLPGWVRDMQVKDGLVHVVVHDSRPNSGMVSYLITLDAHLGRVIWRRDLGPDSPRRLRLFEDRLLLERTRSTSMGARATLLILDALTGRPQREVSIPVQNETEPLQVDDVLVYPARASSGGARGIQRFLQAIDVRTGETRWRRPQSAENRNSVTALAAARGALIVLRSNGDLLTLDLRDGKERHRTRIDGGQRSYMRPAARSPVLVIGDTIVFHPPRAHALQGARPPAALVAFNFKSGKRVWWSEYPKNADLGFCDLVHQGQWLTSITSYRVQMVPHLVVRVLNSKTGEVQQEVHPEGFARQDFLPRALVSYGSVLIVGRQGASLLHGKPAAGR